MKCLEFQFLIGTLKTPDGFIATVPESVVFQFLIGTLKTAARRGRSLVLGLVSIPHRYAENRDLKRLYTLYERFQFLIGTLKTQAGEDVAAALVGFNSS